MGGDAANYAVPLLALRWHPMSLGTALSVLDKLLGLLDRALHKSRKRPKYEPIKPVPVKGEMDPREEKRR